MENFRLRQYVSLYGELPKSQKIWVLTAGGMIYGYPASVKLWAQMMSGESPGDLSVRVADFARSMQDLGIQEAGDETTKGRNDEFYFLEASWGKSLDAENITFQWAVVSFDAVLAWGLVG